ncbi:sensor domain-containing diguanylate cyclase [Aromatoleum petrolei]|uniref:sensor domain-containing diguanylate cyclase n=1 Tax=Aromatoleum petrolei TaxID=76116 RepID=UPI00145C4401|nr:diguanylate cyclase [Aromatoleum petrolei]
MKLPWRKAMPSFLLTAAIAVTVIWRSEAESIADERQVAERMAVTHGAAIRRNIERALSATYPLAALVRQANGTPANVEQLAGELLPFYAGASALALAPDGIVRIIVPEAENAPVIGTDLLHGPTRDKEAIRARDTATLTLTPPVQLVQGGVAAIGRLPVHLGSGPDRKFWGLISVLIRFPDVLQSADLDHLKAEGYAYHLWRNDPDGDFRVHHTIATSGDPLIDPVSVAVPIPNGTWMLSVSPVDGWGDPLNLVMKSALGLSICILAAGLHHSIESLRRERAEVERRIELRTRELARSEQRFRDIAHISADWIWEVDAEGRYTFASASVRSLLDYSPEELLGKTPFELMPPDEAARVSAALAETVAARAPFRDLENIVLHKNGTPMVTLTSGTPILDDEGKLLGYRGVDRDITARRKLEEQIRQLAFLDTLTQLPNRRLFTDRLNQALALTGRSACYGALLFMDLDRFKPLNDEHGHAVGDLLLLEVAERLKRCVREADTVARFGGDEFVVLIGALATDRAVSLAHAAAIAQDMLESLSQPYHLRKRNDVGNDITIEHHCSASIGVTLFRGHETTVEALLQRADTAMYRAKAAGRNTVRFAESDEAV